MYVSVKSLPQVVLQALNSVGFAKSDIEVFHTQTVTLGNQAYGKGYKGYMILVNLNNGTYESHKGSWGGCNMFEQKIVDWDNTPYEMVPGMVVIKGQIGGGHPVSANIYADLSTSVLPLDSATPKVTDKQALILGAIKGLKSGDYRNQRLNELGTRKADIEELATMGLLKINKAGAVSITTEGKNLASNRTW